MSRVFFTALVLVPVALVPVRMFAQHLRIFPRRESLRPRNRRRAPPTAIPISMECGARPAE